MKSRRHWLLSAGLACSLAAGLVRCAAPTEIVVEVTTDVDCRAGERAAVFTARTLAELRGAAPASVSESCRREPEVLGRVVLRPPSAQKDGPLSLQVALKPDGGAPESCTSAAGEGCIVARRSLMYRKGESTTLKVRLAKACVDVVCPEGTTCVARATGGGGPEQATCASATVKSECLGETCEEKDLEATGGIDAGVAVDATAGDAGVGDAGVGDAGVGTVIYDAGGGLVRGLAYAFTTDGRGVALGWIESPTAGQFVCRTGLLVGGGLATLNACPVKLTPTAPPLAMRSPSVFVYAADGGTLVGLLPSVLCNDARGIGLSDAGVVLACGTTHAFFRPDATTCSTQDNRELGYAEGRFMVQTNSVVEYVASSGACTGPVPKTTFDGGLLLGIAILEPSEVTNPGYCVSARDAGGIYCSSGTGALQLVVPGVFAEDLALITEGSKTFLYYAAPPGIWRVEYLPPK